MALSRRAATVAAAAAILLASAPATARAQGVQRAMYVSVLNDAGAPVPDLGPADFVVREDNVAREVLRVAPAVEPMQIAILIDNSVAATQYITDIRNAVRDLVTVLTTPSETTGRNELAIITLADRPTTLTDYTTSRAQLLKGIDRIFAQPQSGTLLLEGLIDVSKAVKTKGATRPVIIAIVTEGPELSERYYDLVLQPLQRSGAAFHAIVVGTPAGGMGDAERDRGVVLDRGTKDTGGRRDNVLTSMSLGPKLKEVADELTHQYRVTYARPQSLIPPERVTVTAARPGLTARGTLITDRGPWTP